MYLFIIRACIDLYFFAHVTFQNGVVSSRLSLFFASSQPIHLD